MISEAEREQAIALVKRLFAEAVQLQGAGREGEAIALYNRLLRIAPDQPPALHNLGVLYRNAKRYPAAVACYRRALLADPKAVSTLSSLGNAYKDWGKLDEALAVHRRAAQLAPEDVGVLHNLAITLRERDENAEALELLEKVVGLDPKRGEAVWDLALTRLHLGDYERGWDGYEARWALAEHKPPKVSIPPWDGGPRPGKTLLLTTEQGFGDAIQFARFIPAARALFGRVLLSCREPLHRLMAAAPGVDAVVPYSGRVPAADFHAHLLSLPRFLGHRFDDLPGAVGYLGAPDPNPAVATTLNALRGFKVGIVWSGSVTFKGNDKRATSLERFLRFLEVPGVCLFSLQKGPPAQELLALKGE
ncbi:MAG: tetratricopeptide repeat protein, partial [Alphaproteobacteria bacterium]|nr:tetratricopeptide repeat protein [Alphaproteobacteria bacterium]